MRVVAIDGPAASGKSSTARAVARAIGFHHLDSGALYRALTRVALDAGPRSRRSSTWPALLVLAERRGLGLRPEGEDFVPLLDGAPAEHLIRTPEVTAAVSAVSAVPEVRDWANARMRALAEAGVPVVVDGRDIGSVVFPEAGLKIFLYAKPLVRAMRRLAQRGEAGDAMPRSSPRRSGSRPGTRPTPPGRWRRSCPRRRRGNRHLPDDIRGAGRGDRLAGPGGVPPPGPLAHRRRPVIISGSRIRALPPWSGFHPSPQPVPVRSTPRRDPIRMSEPSVDPSDLDTPAATPTRRFSSQADDLMSTTGLMVRADLYDEDYSEDEYEQMLSMYEGTMASIVEGEIVKSKVLRITENAVILDVGFKSEGSVPLDEFKEPPDGRR